jgi:hypothetical protein
VRVTGVPSGLESGRPGKGQLCLVPEKPRTFSERESKFTVKFFTLQFFTHFSSLIYIAFILGRCAACPTPSISTLRVSLLPFKVTRPVLSILKIIHA